MMKEAGLFVISAGFLVYFISPVADEPKPEQPVVETKQKTVSAEDADADYWGDEADDDENVESEFVFGEPMISTDPVAADDEKYDINYDDDGDRDSAVASVAEQSGLPAPNPRRKSSRIHSSSPKPGELGSAENPIPLN